jgi:predicted TPR repeat methyltransferase
LANGMRWRRINAMKPHNIAAYYDVLAPMYDAATANGAWTPNAMLEQHLAGLPTPRTIVDFGAGTGQTLAVLRAHYPDASVLAVDVSASMLEHCRNKWPDVTTRQESLSSFVASSADKFDLITAIGVLEFVPELPDLLPRMAKLLAPGGRMMCTYEPLISGLGQQSLRSFVSSGSAISTDASFETYHWSASELISRLPSDIEAVLGPLFVAYERASEPVVYDFLHLTAT